jgi:hypothetical protein
MTRFCRDGQHFAQAVARSLQRVFRHPSLPLREHQLLGVLEAVQGSAVSTKAAVTVRERKELIFVLVCVQISVLLTKTQ